MRSFYRQVGTKGSDYLPRGSGQVAHIEARLDAHYFPLHVYCLLNV